MVLSKICIIWVDSSFDGEDKYRSMKDEFEKHTAAPPPDPINAQICSDLKEDLQSSGTSFITVRTPEKALIWIAENADKEIFLITSGSWGEEMVPEIVKQYPQVHSFYIYCLNMLYHAEWAIQYCHCLEMFDHQVDLLIRLIRDIATYFVKQGKSYLDISAPYDALTCFNHAKTLEKRANDRDTVNGPFMKGLQILGDENKGLIHKALNMIQQQYEGQPLT